MDGSVHSVYRLGRVSVLAVLLLFLALFSTSWAACISSSDWNTRQDCNYINDVNICGGAQCYLGKCNCVSENKVCDWGSVHCINMVCCDSKIEADSVTCVPPSVWNSEQQTCEPPCDAECQCAKIGGEWKLTNGGYCVPDCKDQMCCDSLDQNLPTEVDTTWEGCVATDPTNDRCVILPTVQGTSVEAECTAKSRYRICTTRYVFSKTAGQCAPISSNNCVTMDKSDSMCTKVLCHAYQQKSISALNYNASTKCYEGLQTVEEMMVCDNGIRESRGQSKEQFQVCDSWLDENDITIDEYLRGPQGPGPMGPGPGPNVSDPNDPNPGPNPDYPDFEDDNPYTGGPSVNGEGDTVQNSPSPYVGTIWTPQQEIVTEYDSTTNSTVIVKNSEGGDSVTTKVTPAGVRCLGYSGGVATLTDGSSTWTCEAMSCSQAVISASIVGGSCSSNPGNNRPNDNGPTINDRLPVITGTNTGPSSASSFDFGQFQADMNSGFVNSRKHQDSLWFATFGENLDAVRNFRQYIADLAVLQREMVDSASSANSYMIASASSTNSRAIASASSQLTSAIGSASSANSQAIEVLGDRITTRLTNISNNITSASSENSNAVVSQIQATDFNVTSSLTSVKSSVDNMRSSYRDSVHEGNSMLRAIFSALDTGGIVNRDINGVRDAIVWNNDRLVVAMDSNATRVADAIDNLQVEVKLDSISVNMPDSFVVNVPHDTILDSINDNLKSLTSMFEMKSEHEFQVRTDTSDFGTIMRTVYDSTSGDTSMVYDSSFSEHMKQVAGTTIDGSDVADSYVDSVESTLSSRLDSSMAAYNLRSDTAVIAYKDSMLRFYGVDTIGDALNDFFSGYSGSCPRECLKIELTGAAILAGQTSTIDFGYYLCELQLIGGYSALDFIKLVMKIYTAFLCMTLLLQFVPMSKGGKR